MKVSAIPLTRKANTSASFERPKACSKRPINSDMPSAWTNRVGARSISHAIRMDHTERNILCKVGMHANCAEHDFVSTIANCNL